MNSVRLLPVVMIAIGALFLFKLLGIVSGEGYSLSGAQTVIAQEAPAETAEEPLQDDMAAQSGNTLADEASKTEEEMAAEAEETPDAQPITINKSGDVLPYEAGDLADTERAILTRLSERRKELDALEQKLQVQEDIVRAAEKRLETRAAELKEIEARIQLLVDRKEGLEDEQFGTLVSMYENMKPKDAARIFDRLDMMVLVRMVERMNPRKMAAVLAEMDSEKAEALTINLANANLQDLETVQDADEGLPQIIGQ